VDYATAHLFKLHSGCEPIRGGRLNDVRFQVFRRYSEYSSLQMWLSNSERTC
jgi:hypothetical protein